MNQSCESSAVKIGISGIGSRAEPLRSDCIVNPPFREHCCYRIISRLLPNACCSTHSHCGPSWHALFTLWRYLPCTYTDRWLWLEHTPTWARNRFSAEIIHVALFSFLFFSSLLEHTDFLLSLECLFSQKIRNYSCKAPKAPREMAIIQKINPKNEPQSAASALIKRRTSGREGPVSAAH